MQKAGDRIEDVAALMKATEDLRVACVNPFPSKFPGVLSLDDREVVANVRAIYQLVDVRLEKEGLPETEIRGKTDGCIRHRGSIDSFARPRLTRIREVRFGGHSGRQSAEPV